jgi:hypothetical protein
MKSASDYVKEVLGRDVPAVLIDGDGGKLHITSNRSLENYTELFGFHVGIFSKYQLGEDGFRDLGSGARFFKPYNVINEFGVERREPRPPKEYETQAGFDKFYREETGYARVACRKIWFSIGRHIDQLDFPEDSVLVHEMTHGISLGQNEVFQKYGDPEIIDEAFAAYMELRYLDAFYPEDAKRWRSLRAQAKTDETHTQAFRHVLDDSLPFEEILQEIRKTA